MAQITNLKFPRIGNTYSAEKQDALENAAESNGTDSSDVFTVLRAAGQGGALGTGTITANQEPNNTLIGIGTLFTAELSVGDNIFLDGAKTIVDTIINDLEITIIPALKNIFINANYAYKTTAYASSWKTDNIGTSNDDQISLPLISSGSYNFDVDWGDGNQDTITAYNQAEVTHTYTSAGTFVVKLTGKIQGWQFNNGGDKDKLLDISAWGPLVLTTNAAFRGCSNFIGTATDPALISTTDLSLTFNFCDVFNGAIGNWDVSNVTDMSDMFWGAALFNQPLDNWDVSSVTNMNALFIAATVFNQPLNSWDVSSVTDMQDIFDFAQAFDQPLDNWDVSSVTNMAFMFQGSLFNRDISGWNVSLVTDMQFMFTDTPFNQDIGLWDVSNVTIMDFMFNDCADFNQDISGWDVSSVTSLLVMFRGALAFNQDINVWNTGSVIFMTAMFEDAASFNQNINSWDVSLVTDMRSMFENSAFNQDISSWQIQNVTTMSLMFNLGALSTINYDLLLIAWDALIVQSGVPFGVGTTQFSAGAVAAARQSLIDDDSWSITDGGQVP